MHQLGSEGLIWGWVDIVAQTKLIRKNEMDTTYNIFHISYYEKKRTTVDTKDDWQENGVFKHTFLQQQKAKSAYSVAKKSQSRKIINISAIHVSHTPRQTKNRDVLRLNYSQFIYHNNAHTLFFAFYMQSLNHITVHSVFDRLHAGYHYICDFCRLIARKNAVV